MKRHSLDLTSLVFALVFLVYASLWPLWRLDVLDERDFSWLPATALILIGLLGLSLSIARSRPDRSTADDGRTAYDDEETTVLADETQ